MSDSEVTKSYHAETVEDQQKAYDDWAKRYEPELCGMGYRIPAMIASVFTRYVAEDATPVLDAGCGGGIQAEPLAMLGYGPIIGIDLSDGMLEIARGKNIYAELKQQTLGEKLDFPDDHFEAIISSGTITPKHAPPHSFKELIRIAKPDAPVIFSMRDDPLQEPEYPDMLDKLESEGKWSLLFKGDKFLSMPYGEPQIMHRVYVYKVS